MLDPLTTYPTYRPGELPRERLAAFRQAAANPNATLHQLLDAANAYPEVAAANAALHLTALTEPELLLKPERSIVGGLAAIARVPALPSGLHALLLESSSARVVAAAINNPRTTPELLERALTSLDVKPEPHAPGHVPTQARLRAELYRRLPLARARALAEAHLPDDYRPAQALLTRTDVSFADANAYAEALGEKHGLAPRLAHALLHHPDAPEAFLLEHVDTVPANLWHYLATTAAATPRVLQRLAERLVAQQGRPTAAIISSAEFVAKGLEAARTVSDVAIEALGRRPDLPDSAMRYLHEHGDARARTAIAQNPNLPTDLLHLLLEHDDGSTRRAAARHPRAPWAARELDPHDYHSIIGYAQNTRVGLRHRLRAIEHLNAVNMFSLAHSPHTPSDIHEHLRQSPDLVVVAGSLRSLLTPPEVLVRAARERRSGRVLRAIAEHPSTPEATLEELAQHDQHDVQRAAAKAIRDNRAYGRPPVDVLAAALPPPFP